MATVPRLTLLPYLQAWTPANATLTLNVLAMPDGDQRTPLTDGFGVPGPAIADADLVLTANLSKDVHELPMLTTVDDQVRLHPHMPAAAERHAVYDQLEQIFHPSVAADIAPRDPDRTLHKYLAKSYRDAFDFAAPRTELAITDDSYLCLLRCPPKAPLAPPTPVQYSWLDALGYAMREPTILRAAGLLHTLELELPAQDFYVDGGWLFLTLDPAGDYAAAVGLPGFLKSMATRVPALSVSRRPVFTAVLFPVFADPTAAAAAGGDYDEVFPEAIRFDDGFAKIVHASQQKGMLYLDEEGASPPPPQDLGVFLGWDDEDVLIGQNRHVGLNPDGTAPPEAPRGVVGYRVDVREEGAADWASLAAVHTDSFVLGTVDLGPVDGELRTEVYPRRLGEKMWLPAYFTTWAGGSLVTTTVEDRTLRGVTAPTPPQYDGVPVDPVPLRYGRRYEFRVRMADGSGGGPPADAEPFNPGERRHAVLPFRRHVPPKKLRLDPPQASAGQWTVAAARPLIGYPDAVFADAPNAVNRLLAIHQQNLVAAPGDLQEVGLPDVDVAFAEVRVLVTPPAFDPIASDGWLELYTTTRRFPNNPAAKLTLTADYVDVADLASLDVSGQAGPPGSVAGTLPVPTARDIRVELRALCRDAAGYFASDDVRRGPAVGIEWHEPAAADADVLPPPDPARGLRSVFLQPDSVAEPAHSAVVQVQNDPSPVLVQRLAQAAGLIASETTLLPTPGERVVFGCAGLKHRLSPDNGSLVLGQLAELPNQWLNVVRLDIDRDWTWKGAGDPAFQIQRTLHSLPGGAAEDSDLGSVQLIHSLNTATAGGELERDHTALVFIDAFPAPLLAGLPYELEVTYTISLALEGGGQEEVTVTSTLPVTTPPRQVPSLTAAGHALTPYETDASYSTTGRRGRMLWFEFAEPLEDPRDAYFVRVLAHAPDPLLLAAAEPVEDPPAYSCPALDPELARVVVPGQGDDFAGLSVMQKLIPAQGAEHPRHFAVPRPPGVSAGSPELLGFYTYEIRVGHDRGTPGNPFWSTAQGRFGEPIVIEGVQHPPPPLDCGVTRLVDGIVVSASFAQPYYNGENVLPRPPNTDIWVALYAQVHQADKASMRNIELDLRRGLRDERKQHKMAKLSRLRELQGYARWSTDEIDALLATYGLGDDTPLSVLTIELLPEPNSPFSDPLRGDLGDVRVLRTSPLTAIPKVCC